MGDRTFHIRQVWSSAIAIEIEISDMGSEMREKHGETMETYGETMEKRWRNDGETMEKRWRNDGETGRSKGEGGECKKEQKRGVEKVGAGHRIVYLLEVEMMEPGSPADTIGPQRIHLV